MSVISIIRQIAHTNGWDKERQLDELIDVLSALIAEGKITSEDVWDKLKEAAKS